MYCLLNVCGLLYGLLLFGVVVCCVLSSWVSLFGFDRIGFLVVAFTCRCRVLVVGLTTLGCLI